MTKLKQEPLAQECADYATSLRSAAMAVQLEGRPAPASFLRAADLFERAATELNIKQARNAKLEAELVAEAARTAEQKLRANQMTIQHRMQAAMNAEARAALAEETKSTDGWRWLALQFDGHRIQTLGHLKVMVQEPEKHADAARIFLAAAPLPGEAVLAMRIAAMAMEAVPQGWKLVPMEPTRAMLDAYMSLNWRFHSGRADWDAMLSAAPTPPAHERKPQCWCTTCRPITLADMRFVVCPKCGNKRCPHAHNHEQACSSSNAVGQAGSSWEHVTPVAGGANANGD